MAISPIGNAYNTKAPKPSQIYRVVWYDGNTRKQASLNDEDVTKIERFENGYCCLFCKDKRRVILQDVKEVYFVEVEDTP